MQTRIFFTLLVVILYSCSGNQTSSNKSVVKSEESKKVHKPEFQDLLDSLNLVGSILLYDLQDETYYSNNFDWANKGHLPASTFKIVNSIIGLETGVIEDGSTVFKWDGQDRWSSAWEKDLILKDAFQLSCVPCYQEVARGIGVKRMNDFLLKLEYKNMVFDQSTIDNFWLMGSSRISQMQQITFLKRLYHSKLPISKRTENLLKKLLIIESKNDYVLSGKTGLSNELNHYNGWFIGFIEREGKTIFFATNIEPLDQLNRNGFSNKRKNVTMTALNHLGYLGKDL